MQKKSLNNPLVAAAATPAVVNVTTKAASGMGTLVKAGLILLGGLGIVFFTSKAIRKARIESLKRRAFTDANIKAAIDIFDAIPAGLKEGTGGFFNPFGIVKDAINKVKLIWQKTDTDRIMQIAESITDIQLTASAFKTLYREDLITLLQNAMEPDKYDEFVRRARRDKNPIPNKNIPKVNGQYVITKKETIGYVANPALFKTFDYTALQKGVVWKMKKRIPANTFVGIAQGKSFTDKSTNIEYLLIVDIDKKYYIGLPMGDVKSMNEAKFRKIEKSVNKNFTLGHLSDLVRMVRTNKPAYLFLNKHKRFKTPAPQDVYIGEFMGISSDENESYINFRSFNGLELYVNSDDVVIE